MKVQQIRHATMLIDIKGNLILVDPMFSKAGKMAAVPDVPNGSNNPLVELPVEPAALTNSDAIIVTHTHRDHFDDAAINLLPHNSLLFCQPSDEQKIKDAGFLNVEAIGQSLEWKGITITRTEGQHGCGIIGQKMGPVSGFMIETNGEPSLYITGDTIWCPEVQGVLEKHHPQIIICFSGEARFSSGTHITMSKDDIHNVCSHAPSSRVIVTHLEAWNHCSLTRRELQKYINENSLDAQVYIPIDGEWMDF